MKPSVDILAFRKPAHMQVKGVRVPMAPVALQCMWSMRASAARRADTDDAPTNAVPRSELWKLNINSCHVWAEDSPVVARVAAGTERAVPVFLGPRLEKLGIGPEEWRKRMGD